MTKLSPTTVYVPVLNEFPVFHNYNRKLVDYLDLSAYRNDDTYIPADVFKKVNGDLLSVANLQKQQLYTFTREELEKILGYAFEAGGKYNSEEFNHLERGMNLLAPNNSQYIQSLF